MFIDTSGGLGMAHARDMHRSAEAFRASRVGRRSHALRAFTARGQLGRTYNYRTR